MLERIGKYKRDRIIVTVKGELPSDPHLRILGNKRWPGEKECEIIDFNDSHVKFVKLDSSVQQSISMKYLSESWDDRKHRPMFLVDASGA